MPTTEVRRAVITRTIIPCPRRELKSPLRHTGAVRARSAVFDLYGDHLTEFGCWAPISSVVALLQSCGIAPAATRTAVSRMVTQEWLTPARRSGVRGYLATPAATARLAAAHQRIYRPVDEPWDGTWRLIVLDRAVDRAHRDRVAATLSYLGYGRLAAQTWVAAHRNPELESALAPLDVGWQDFEADHLGEPADLAAQAWDLGALAERYHGFLDRCAELLPRARTALAPPEAYPVRAELVHRWRGFLFSDPELPSAVLPHGWPGAAARAHFLEAAERLRPAARTFVGDTLALAGAPLTGAE